MKIPGKVLAISGAVVLISYLITIKFKTPYALVEIKEVPTKEWLVLGKSMQGGLHSDKFGNFFKSMNELKKEM